MTAPTTTPAYKNAISSLIALLSQQSPLKGKHVMVPMTTKAFFPGTLDPYVSCGDTDLVGTRTREEETVLVRLGDKTGIHVDMTRSEAAAFLHRRYGTNVIATPPTRKTSEKPDPPIAKSKKIRPVSSRASTTPDPPPGEFFEIVEEYDSSGTQIKAEAKNLTRELKHLTDHIEGNGDETADVVIHPVHDDGDETSGNTADRGAVSAARNEANYDAISTRLEDLILLEEKDDREKRSNKRSSKKLQSLGWSKGFLNSDHKKNVKKSVVKEDPPISSREQKGKTSEENESPSKAGSNDNKLLPCKPKPKPNDSLNRAEKKTRPKVTFSSREEIREIPKIGTRSFKEVSAAAALLSGKKQKPPPPASSFEPDVFSGVIAESQRQANRQAGPVKEKAPSRFSREREMEVRGLDSVVDDGPQHVSSEKDSRVAVRETSSPPKVEKKLSRFAQQRLMERGN